MALSFRYGSLLFAVLAIAELGCSSPEKEWKAAQQQNTKQAYESFLKRFPTSPLASEATQAIRDVTPERGRLDLALRSGGVGSYAFKIEGKDPMPVLVPEISSPERSRIWLYFRAGGNETPVIVTEKTRFEGVKAELNGLKVWLYSGHEYKVTGKHGSTTKVSCVFRDGGFAMEVSGPRPGAEKVEYQVPYLEAKLIRYLGPMKQRSAQETERRVPVRGFSEFCVSGVLRDYRRAHGREDEARICIR